MGIDAFPTATRPRSAVAGGRTWQLRMPTERRRRERAILVAVVAASLLVAIAAALWPEDFPLIVLAPAVVVTGLYLPLRDLSIVYALITGIAIVATARSQVHSATSATIAVITLSALMLMMGVVASSRGRVHAVGFRGEDLFVELRDRISQAAVVPALPGPWSSQAIVRSAHGEAFSGDFMVTDLTRQGRHLEVALVDVSGKGRRAGTRSLLLSGAFGALLGSLPPEKFLDAANSYLVHQGWREGFATAVHIDVDLTTGEFTVGNAGHPPAVHYAQGAGVWEVLEGGRSPVLGIMQGITFDRHAGRLAPGDALMIYSDGLVEARDHDLSAGTDRMLGAASEALVRDGASIAEAVIDAARSGESDDRAVFVIRRG